MRRYFKKRDFSDALRLIGNTMREVRKLEDKPLMMEIQLTESQVHYALSNTPKAKASLTSARTLAASVYCPPALQAAIDLQAGILAADEGDFRTGCVVPSSHAFHRITCFLNVYVCVLLSVCMYVCMYVYVCMCVGVSVRVYVSVRVQVLLLLRGFRELCDPKGTHPRTAVPAVHAAV